MYFDHFISLHYKHTTENTIPPTIIRVYYYCHNVDLLLWINSLNEYNYKIQNVLGIIRLSKYSSNPVMYALVGVASTIADENLKIYTQIIMDGSNLRTAE